MKGTLAVTGDPDADQLLNTDPLAVLIGMLLDQQVPMEWAFIGPYRLRERLGGTLDAAAIAAMDPGELEAIFKQPRAIHRFPGSMAKRTQQVCQHLVDVHGGDAADVWESAADGADLVARLRALPGYGEEKAKIFTAVLGKRFAVRPVGWEAAAGVFGDAERRSVADCDSPDSLAEVRVWKKAMKAKGKSKAEQP
jgi:uncharacterized HhH-GPD family protein